MKPQLTLGRATTPEGKDIVLYSRDGVYSIRIDGLELMSSRAHGSEEALARIVLPTVAAERPSVLIGGLGMGYTLRAALDHTPPDASIAVAEVFPQVVEWNFGPLAPLAGSPLDDPRVRIEQRDVLEVIERAAGAWDAILLDVDNGPDAFTLARNKCIYDRRGLARVQRALRQNGVLGVWSADPDPAFERRLAHSGFKVSHHSVPARQGQKGPKHTIFVARRP